MAQYPRVSKDVFTADGADGSTRGGTHEAMRSFGVYVVRAAGSTDVVDLDLYGSPDGTNWVKLGDVTASVANGTGYGAVVDKPTPYWRIECVTVGAGNTLHVYTTAMD